MAAVLTWFLNLLRSLTQIFHLAALKGRIEACEGRADSDYLKIDARLDARNAEYAGVIGALTERVAHLEGRIAERDVARQENV